MIFGTAKKMQKTKKIRGIFLNIIMLIIVVIVVIAALEIFTRLFLPQDLNYLQFDSNLRYKGVNNIETTFKTKEFNNTIKLNDKGLRDYNHDYESNKYRILFLGDSMTFGYGVEAEETYPKVLEKILNEKNNSYETINAGITAYNTAQELTYLETEGLKYKPNLVILGFMLNDVSGNYFEGEAFDIENNKLKAKYPVYNFSFLSKIKNYLSTHSHFARVIRKNLGLWSKMDENKKVWNDRVIKTIAGINWNEMNASWNKTFLLINKMKEDLDKENIKLLVVVLPTKEQIDDKQLKEMVKDYKLNESEIKIDNSQKIIGDYLKKNKIIFLDLFKDFKNADKNNDFYYDYDGHFNKNGHEFAAQIVYKRLKEIKITK